MKKKVASRETSRRNPRRGTHIAKAPSEDDSVEKSADEEMHDNANDLDNEYMSSESESNLKTKSRISSRSGRRKTSPETEGTTRRSSRSTKYQASLKEPTESVRDLFSGSSKGDTKDKNKSVQKNKKSKSLATRHRAIRRTVKVDAEDSEEDNWGYEEQEEDEEIDEEDEYEDEEDEDEMKIERIIAARSERRRVWKEICSKINTSEIELGSRWYQEDDKETDDETYEERFLVKWNGFGYLHCSWEKQNDLVELLENTNMYLRTFFRKSVNGLLFSSDERCDGDYFDPAYTQIDRILEVSLPEKGLKDAKSNYGIILDKTDPNYEWGTGRQFLVKWGNLPYSESTYEFERDLIINEVEYEEDLEQFAKRSKKPAKSEMKKHFDQGDREHRRLYKFFGDNSKMSEAARDELIIAYQKGLADVVYPNGGQLRDYQAEGVSWMMANYVNSRSSLLADEMGLGKTLQTCAFISQLSTRMRKRGPFLVVAPLSTLEHWKREFNTWTDLNSIVYHGSAENREQTRKLDFAYEVDRPPANGVAFNSSFLKKCQKKNKSKFEKLWMVQVVITTPEMICTDDFTELTAIEWDVLVVDEAHRMKNKKSKLTGNLLDSRFTFHHTLLLTGTPIQNNMAELWTLLNFIDDEKFTNLDDFLESYGDMKSKEGIDSLHENIRPYILRRLKEDVEKSVPPKEETLIEVELTTLQKKYYRALYERNVQFLHRNKKKALDGPSLNNLAMQLRKCCNHPFLLKGVEEEMRSEEKQSNSMIAEGDFLVKSSGKLVLLDKLLPRLRESGHRVLIFSQFKIMLDILEDYFLERKFKAERIDGSITGKKRQMAIDRFQGKVTIAKEVPFIMMLSTRAGGVGINLTAADTCIIFDSDWNPQNDLQAQARCHRIGQTKSVKVYRLLTRKTYEMQMFHMSSMKMGLDQAVLQGFEGGSNQGEGSLSKDEVEKLLRHGAYDIFNEEKTGSTDAESNAFVEQDIDWILERRSKTVVHENTGSRSNVAGGTFSKASFKAPKSDGKNDGKGELEDVDIDDPDFWKKMVGEAKVDESKDLSGKKRKRNKTNYNENTLSGNFDVDESFSSPGSDSDDDSDDENSASSETSRKRRRKEPSKWGRKDSQGWKRNDAEKLVKALFSYGYGNIQWEDFRHKSGLKDYDVLQIKRLSWAIIFTTFREAAEDGVIAARRKADRLAQKNKDMYRENNPEVPSGGVLAQESDAASEKDEKKKLLETEFQKLLFCHLPWMSTALQDAKLFAASNKSRPRYIIERYTTNSSSRTTEQQTLQGKNAIFAQNLWPQLKNRGWKVEQCSHSGGETITKYIYDKNTYKSRDEIMEKLPSLHPELTRIVEEVKQSIISFEKKDQHQHASFVQSLAPNSFKLSTLDKLLEEFGPLQLVVDRTTTKSISLTRRLLTSCLISFHAHSVIKRARTTVSSENIVEKISQSLLIDKRMNIPHPAWTKKHDAVLIMAIEKHGWIESDACCRAITEDKTIQWGYPFDSHQKSETELFSPTQINATLFKVAKRAAQFLFIEGEALESIKEFRETIIVDTYRLKAYRDSNIEGRHLWEAEEASFTNDNNKGDEYEIELPTKKDLVKRAKALLQKPINLSNDTLTSKTGAKIGNDFCVLDQKNICNVFLAEVLRALTKVSFNHSNKRRQLGRRLMNSAVNEARIRKEESLQIADTATANSMQRIIDHCAFVNRFIQTQPVQAKNVIRAVLKVPLVSPKNGSNQLFPPECVTLPMENTNPKSRKTEKRKQGKNGKNHKRDTGATGDKAISDAMFNVTTDTKTVTRLLNDESYIQLSAPETLLLTVICSQGLPTWSKNWRGLINASELVKEEQGPGFENAITFWGMGEVFETAASVWHHTASQKLERYRLSFKAQFENFPDGNSEKQAAKLKLKRLEEDEYRKQVSLATARDYKNHPRKLAKKCIMLLESVRKHMDPIETLIGKNGAKISQIQKSENLLGTGVMNWFSEEIQRWAQSLKLVDVSGNPLSYIAADFAPKQQGKELHTAAALMERDGCRAVFGQIAQQSRVRQVFLKNTQDDLNQLLIKAVDKFICSSEWSEKPCWWGKNAITCEVSVQHDYFVLESLLAFGYSGIEETIADYIAQQGIKENPREELTRAAIQRRANQLTRTLDVIEKTRRAVQEISKKTSQDSLLVTTISNPPFQKRTPNIVQNEAGQIVEVELQDNSMGVTIPSRIAPQKNEEKFQMLFSDGRIYSEDVGCTVENVQSIIDVEMKEKSISTPEVKSNVIVLDETIHHTENTVDLTGEV